MPLPTVSLNDLLNEFITSYNVVATTVGDLALLQTTEDSNLVAAINSLIGQAGVDSAVTISLSRTSISVVDSGGDGSLSYNSATGVITYRGPSAAEVRAKFSAVSPIAIDSNGQISIPDATTSIKGAASFSSANFDVTSGGVSIKAGGVDSAALGALSVATAKLQNGSVTSTKLATNSVTFAAMADSAVGSNELRQAVQLIIYDSVGTPVKTLYGAGE